MSDVRWEPVIDSRGFDRDQDGNVYAYCRAVPVPWSQEPPTVAIGEAAGYWVWRKQWGKMVSYARLRHSRLPGGTPALWLYYDDGLRTPLDEMPPDTWYMPATVPQPPSIGEVTE